MCAKINRPLCELIAKLRQHCAVLEDFYNKACREGRTQYCDEIVGKLRLLVYKSRTNRPLLLDLMSETGIEVPATIDGPGGRRQVRLQDWLAETACANRMPSGELVALSHNDLIALWSQQSGAAHEDWALDERLAVALNTGLFVGGLPISGYALCGMCGIVLGAAKDLLAQLPE